jgi:hypothetical protein
MKKFITTLIFTAIFLAANSQVKISSMPAITGNTDSLDVPVLQNGINKKVKGYKFGYNKEPIITAGTTAQYWRGDKTFQNFPAIPAQFNPIAGTGTLLTGTYPNITFNTSGWDINGTTGTTSGTNFIGTTDNKSLSFRTNNLQRATLDSNGKFGIGITPAFKLHVSGDFTLIDTAKHGVNITAGGINTLFPFNIRRNTVSANGNEFPFGPAAYIENTHYGTIGTTFWGTNVVTPQRSVLQLRDRIALNNGTYTFLNNVNTQSNALFIHSQIGSNDNSGTPLVINTGNSASDGQNAVFVRTDYWPGNDLGTTLKHYNGWYSMYGGVYDMGGGVGSTLQRLHYYNAGGLKDVINFTIDTAVGFYVSKMKGKSGVAINKGFGIYQEGENDVNLFAGPVIVNDSLKVQGLKLYSPMGTPALLVSATDSVRTNFYKYINTGAAITLNLPNPTTVANREHLIINQGTAVITFNYSVWLDAATSISTLDYAYPDNSIKVFSDGTKWIGYK